MHSFMNVAVQDSEGRALWDMTWHKAQSISSGLTPQLLISSGLDRQLPHKAAPSSPGQGAPQGGPSATPMQHPPTSIQEGGRDTPQAAAGGQPAFTTAERTYSSQPSLGATQGGTASSAMTSSSSFPQPVGSDVASSHPERPAEPFGSALDHPSSSTAYPAQSAPSQSSSQGPSHPGDSSRQEDSRAILNQDPSQFSSQYSQNPSQQMAGPPQLGRLSPPGKLNFGAMYR